MNNTSGAEIDINNNDGSNANSYNSGGDIVNFISPTVFTLTGLPANTEVTIVKTSDRSELYHVENSSGDVVYNYGATEQGLDVDVLIHHINYDPNIGSLYDYVLPSIDTSLPITLVNDETYYNP